MKKRICFLFLLQFFVLSFFSMSAQTLYKEMIKVNDKIWVLTLKGTITIIDYTNGRKDSVSVQYPKTILNLVKDYNGDVVVVDAEHQIKRYDSKSNQWKSISSYKDAILELLFDKKNNCYLITSKGIVDIQTGKIYFSTQSLNEQRTITDEWRHTSCYFMDRHDCIWIGGGYGEWGGDLFIFNTQTRKFITPKLHDFNISLWCIQSFFEDNLNVYMSVGMAHMSYSGAIVKFDGFDAKIVFESHEDWKSESNHTEGEYIGTTVFNPFNNSICFYSQHGFFKGDKSKDLSQKFNWKHILKTTYNYKNGVRAWWSTILVSKIIPLSSTDYLFLTQNEGVGYLKNEKLIKM